MLRAPCRQTLSFENHFLAIYRDYLLAELRDANRDRRDTAAARLRDLGFPATPAAHPTR